MNMNTFHVKVWVGGPDSVARRLGSPVDLRATDKTQAAKPTRRLKQGSLLHSGSLLNE